MRIFLQRALMFTAIALSSGTAARAGQLGALISPGPLAKAHTALEGIDKCGQCHEVCRKVTAARCLNCHKPIADRIARKAGKEGCIRHPNPPSICQSAGAKQ